MLIGLFQGVKPTAVHVGAIQLLYKQQQSIYNVEIPGQLQLVSRMKAIKI